MLDGQYRHDVAVQNWEVALHTYRSALCAYRRLLEMRADREAYRTSPSQRLPIIPIAAIPSRPCEVHGLTAREREVADLVARGYSNRQIADRLVLTPGTVANHIAHILNKLGVDSRVHVAAWAVRHGLLGNA